MNIETYIGGRAWMTTPEIADMLLHTERRIVEPGDDVDRAHKSARHYVAEATRRQAELPGSGAAYERAADSALAVMYRAWMAAPLRGELIDDDVVGLTNNGMACELAG